MLSLLFGVPETQEHPANKKSLFTTYLSHGPPEKQNHFIFQSDVKDLTHFLFWTHFGHKLVEAKA